MRIVIPFPAGGLSDVLISGVGLEPLIMMPDQFTAFLKSNREMYAERIRNVGVKLD